MPYPQPVQTFAAEVAAKFAAHAAGQPEDQLRGPTERLLAAMGTMCRRRCGWWMRCYGSAWASASGLPMPASPRWTLPSAPAPTSWASSSTPPSVCASGKASAHCRAGRRTWRASCTRAVAAQDGVGLPQRYAYDPAQQVLQVGTGVFAPVAPAVWDFEVYGLKVVQSWLGHRMRLRKGRKSSPLDDIAPATWPAEYTTELLALQHLLEETLAGYDAQADLLERILAGPLLTAQTIGPAPPALRTAPATTRHQESLDL